MFQKILIMSNIINETEKLSNDIYQMLTKGSLNDVTIILEDGEILAHKDILAARSDYFATMFASFEEYKFTEGKNDIVDLSYCSKLIMDKIIIYLFSGKINLEDLSLLQLLQLINMSSMMMLDDLRNGAQNFVLGFIQDIGVNCASLPELVRGLMLAEQFKLNVLKEGLVLELYRSLNDIPHIPDVVLNFDIFLDLPFSLLEDILVKVELCEEGPRHFKFASTMEKFNTFVYWLSNNGCSESEKERVTNSFNFDVFTAEELLTVVRKSGLYSVPKIDQRVLEIMRYQSAVIQHNNCLLLENSRHMASQANSVKTRDDKIISKCLEIARLKVENKRLKTNSGNIIVKPRERKDYD